MKDQLQKLRRSKNLTQEEFADIIGVKLTTYQKYERDAISPPYDKLVKIADFYNVSLDYLLGRTDVKQMASVQPDPFAGIDVTALEKRIIRKYTELDETMRSICMDAFRQLSEAMNPPEKIPDGFVREEKTVGEILAESGG